MPSGDRQPRSGQRQRSAFEHAYPSLARWVTAHGWIELGPTEGHSSFVRALDIGGMVWEGEPAYPSVDAALRALDAALERLLREEFGEREDRFR